MADALRNVASTMTIQPLGFVVLMQDRVVLTY